jgi:hypothetical protein
LNKQLEPFTQKWFAMDAAVRKLYDDQTMNSVDPVAQADWEKNYGAAPERVGKSPRGLRGSWPLFRDFSHFLG